MLTKPTQEQLDYPCSDGKPMTDKDINRLLMEYVEFAVGRRFASDPMVYVSANLFIYYQQGDKRKNVSPDVFVVRGVERRLRDVYLLWKEGRPPDVIFEFTSRSSRKGDSTTKRRLYRQLGVAEYYVFDPSGEYFKPPLRAYRLVDNRYRKLKWTGSVYSPALDVEMRVEGQWLRLYDPVSGTRLLTADETAERAERAAERADQAEARAQKLEEELRRLRNQRK